MNLAWQRMKTSSASRGSRCASERGACPGLRVRPVRCAPRLPAGARRRRRGLGDPGVLPPHSLPSPAHLRQRQASFRKPGRNSLPSHFSAPASLFRQMNRCQPRGIRTLPGQEPGCDSIRWDTFTDLPYQVSDRSQTLRCQVE